MNSTNQYTETHEAWNSVAHAYEQKFMNLPDYDESYNRFIDLVQKHNASILEIGCGPGNIGKYMLAQKPDWQYTGIDVAPEMIALAQKNIPKGEFEIQDCRNITVPNRQFDGIVCGFCLPYINETETAQLFENCLQLAKTGAIFYVSFIVGDYATSGWATGSNNTIRMFVYYYSEQQILDLLQKSGWMLKDSFDIVYEGGTGKNGHQKILICVKP